MPDTPTPRFVTLDELLTDPEPLDLTVRKREGDRYVDATLRLFVRRPSDIERQVAMGAANAARRAMRKRLADPKSEEHQNLLIEALEDADPEQLRNIWVNGHLMTRAVEIQQNSLEEREYVPEPEGITTSKEEDAYEEAVEAAEKDRLTALLEAIESARLALNKEAEAIDHDALLESAKPAHIETIVASEWQSRYTSEVIVRCTFNDKGYKKPTFKTLSELEKFRSQRPSAYTQLADTHRALLLDMEPGLGKSLGQLDS